MRQKITKLLTLVVTGAAAVVWTINCVILAVYTRHNPPPEFVLPLNIICAAIWWIVFLVQIYRCFRGRRPSEQE